MSPEFMNRLDTVIEREMVRWGVPGIAVGVLHGGEIHTTSDGVVSLETNWPVTTDTLFAIASITKVFTTTLLMMLVDEGKVDLDAPVKTYLPMLRLRDTDALDRIVVRDLVTYLTGFWGLAPEDYYQGEGPDALQRLAESMINAPQMYPPGAFFAYNNANLCLAGSLIEVVSGRQFEDLARERILEPLGMNRTFFHLHEVFGYPVAIGHNPSVPGSRDLVVQRNSTSTRVKVPSGGLFSTLEDLLTFDRFHMGDGDLPQIISNESRLAMQEPLVARSSLGGYQGLGWQVDEFGDVKMVSHWGGRDGCRTRNVAFPGSGVAIAIFTNSLGVAAITAIEQWLVAQLLGIETKDQKRTHLSREELDRFSGTFWNPHTRLKVEASDEGLILTSENLRQRYVAEPVTYFAVGETEFMADPDTCDSLEVSIDFIPEEDGSVTYMRYGGWVARRES